jgi:NADPH:quinone reductase-like Zn-dependent oxidoreductase
MSSNRMVAWQVEGSFGVENLRRVERAVESPGHGEVLVRIEAASLNYRDLLMVKGQYNPRQPLPLVPCSDGAGVVVATGPAVTRFEVGDRVMPLFAPDWIADPPNRETIRKTLGGPLDGTLATHIKVSEGSLVSIPGHLSFEQAATLPCAALTAWSSLVTLGQLVAGQTVLILGTGGVSIFALQFAKLLGLRAIVTSSDDAKLERARQLGADVAINYRSTPEWSRAVREATDGVGVDLVVEVGGAGTFEESVRSTRVGGTVSLIGVLAGGQKDLKLLPVVMNQIRVQGVLVGSRTGFEAMNRAIALARLEPVVDEVFEFADAPAAFGALAGQRHFGKLVVRAHHA